MSSKRLQDFCESPIFTYTSNNLFQGLLEYSEPLDKLNRKMANDDDGDNREKLEQISEKSKTTDKTKSTIKQRKKLIFKENDQAKVYTKIAPHRCQKSNKNFHKFLIKCFFKHFRQFVNPLNLSYRQYVQELNEEVYKDGMKKTNLKSLKKIVGQSFVDAASKKLNRFILRSIITSPQIRNIDICKSQYCKKNKDKKQLLIASKVYGLRLRNQVLSGRLQTR